MKVDHTLLERTYRTCQKLYWERNEMENCRVSKKLLPSKQRQIVKTYITLLGEVFSVTKLVWPEYFVILLHRAVTGAFFNHC